MTRTARASYPRAVNRDRSLSKSGLDGHIQKGGAGRYNWGDLEHKPQFEFAAQYDQEEEEMQEEIPNSDAHRPSPADNNKKDKKPDLSRTTSSMSAEELEAARTIRKNALKKDIDLATIARTSQVVSTSPPLNATTNLITPGSA